MKKTYLIPAMQVELAMASQMLAESLPKAYSEKSSNVSYSRGGGSNWDDEE